MEHEETRKEYNRRKQREHRAKLRPMQNGGTATMKAVSFTVKANCPAVVTIALE